jgi:hypothetical protein
MPVNLRQFADEIRKLQTALAFGVLLHCSHKCDINVIFAGHYLHSSLLYYKQKFY